MSVTPVASLGTIGFSKLMQLVSMVFQSRVKFLELVLNILNSHTAKIAGLSKYSTRP